MMAHADLNPTTYIDEAFPPSILLHGLEDRLVPSVMSNEVAAKMQCARVWHRYTTVEGKDHGFEHFARVRGEGEEGEWGSCLEKVWRHVDEAMALPARR